MPLQLKNISKSPAGMSRLEIVVPSSFHLRIVEQRYAEEIKDAAERLLEDRVEPVFMIDPTQPGKQVSAPLFTDKAVEIDQYGLAMSRLGLREDFTFEAFAVSSSNEMAHAAAKAVADNFGKAYTPLFVYGGVGVGKTHLAQAVAHEYLRSHLDANIIVCASEEFTNGIIEAIQLKRTHDFRKRYRRVKGLFIDDIQFIAGKTTVQEEFFHTFNALHKAGGQIVLTSDRPPSEIPHLEARLRSRFEAGLLVDIGKPDFELKTAITLIKAQHRNIQLSMENAQLIAANIESARQIEGFITRVTTEAVLRKRPITDSLIRGLMGKTSASAGTTPPPLRPLELVRGVAAHFNLTSKQLRGGKRVKQIVTPRHIAMYLLRVDYNLPFTEIGMLFSNRYHTTVMHAVDKISNHLKDKESLRVDVNEVRKGLYS